MNKLTLNSVVFISNFFTHHQKPFSDAMFEKIGSGYKFIETQKISDERKKMGWESENSLEYVVKNEEFYKNQETIQRYIDDADIVIIGSAPVSLIKNRIKNNKIIFKYSERALKVKGPRWKYLFRLYTWRKLNPQKNNVYMLCASAYTSADYSKFGLYRNKCYKWGYFPETKRYENVDNLIASKTSSTILWAARMIDWKHPEKAIEVAKRLKAEGYKFTLNMIGNGVLEEAVRNRIVSENLCDCVNMLGAMKPEEVREHMEKSEIFLFTSDRNEGWGAVLNESMNSACAVVASHAIGSAPFLIEDGKNGLIYEDKNIDDLYNKTKLLLDNSEKRQKIAKEAYYTISNEWNAENAANNFILLVESIVSGKRSPDVFGNGVCSKSKALKDNWYKNGKIKKISAFKRIKKKI